MNVPRIKVCGLTREQDVTLLSRLSIDGAGLIFHPKSPRRVSISRGKELRRLISPTTMVFAVVQADKVDTLLKIAESIRADVLQVHGMMSHQSISRLQIEGYRVAMAYNPVVDQSWRNAISDFVVFDNSTKSESGGSGVPFDWSAVKPPYPKILMLAGGLQFANVESGIRKFKPMIVDLNSGVESAPGIKSAAKLAEIVRLIRKQ